LLEEETTEEEEVIAEPGGIELARFERGEAVEEGEETGATAEAVEEEVGLYHPVVPELLEAFTEAVDLLEALAEGRLTSSEAKAVYFEKVKTQVEKVAIDTREKAKKRTRKAGSKRKSKSSSRRK
jgi:hypothetical protein